MFNEINGSAPKAIIWDWNGTLYDDTAAWLAAARVAYKAGLGVDFSDNQIRDAFDFPVVQTLINLSGMSEVPDHVNKTIIDVFIAESARCEIQSTFAEDALGLLQDIQQAGSKNFIVSNHRATEITNILESYGANEFISKIYANEEGQHVYYKANKIQKINRLLEEHSLNPSECLLIGDTREERRIGKELEIPVISLDSGCNTRATLKTIPHGNIVSSFAEIRKLLFTPNRSVPSEVFVL